MLVKNIVLGVAIVLVSTTGLAQKVDLNIQSGFHNGLSGYSNIFSSNPGFSSGREFQKSSVYENLPQTKIHQHSSVMRKKSMNSSMLKSTSQPSYKYSAVSTKKDVPFFKNRRNVYSSLWAYASLNYLYADLVGLMDANILAQYQTGVVNGVDITPGFLTVAAGFMQIPLANVFLPQLIKNDRTLRWVQIVSGTIMTLVQTGTLFMGKPAPHYALFSTFEIAATSFITINAIKWKIGAKEPRRR